MRASLLLLVFLACGKSGSKPRQDEAPPVPAPAAAAAQPALEPPPADSDAGAIGAAVTALDRTAARRWIDQRTQTLAPPPPDLEAALAALARWSRSPTPLRWSCEPAPELGAMMDLMRFAVELATGPDDPVLEAVAKLSRALRQSDTSAFSIVVGLDGAVELATWFDKRGEKMPVELRLFDPEPDLPLRSAKAEARCALWRIDHAPDPQPNLTFEDYQQARVQAGLPRGDRDAEMVALRAFVRATYDQVVAATTNADVQAILERREVEARQHPSSLYVRIVGAPIQISAATTLLEKYTTLVRR